MTAGPAAPAPTHTDAFRLRRFANWFPLGVAYAFLYMGRYNLTVAKSAFLSNEDFGVVFGAGALVYGVAFLLNGPLTDRVGGRRAMLVALFGASVMNALMGLYVSRGKFDDVRTTMSLLYAGNMYFQSFGAVAIIKVNSSWFHVRERGGFSGIFGTMISSGIFLAFTVNGWIMKAAGTGVQAARWVFFAPAMALGTIFVIEAIVLRDRPSQAGHDDFDTGDAILAADGEQVSVLEVMRRVFTNPIVLTIAFIEFCTGLLRQSAQNWFPIFVRERLVLPSSHWLNLGTPIEKLGAWILGVFAVAIALFVAGKYAKGRAKGALYTVGGLVFLAPFTLAGWGGLLFVAGVMGGNIAGWVSDLLFQSRRAPVAGALYLLLLVAAGFMYFTVGTTTNKVAWADDKSGFLPGDEVVKMAGVDTRTWPEVQRALACVPAACIDGSTYDTGKCMCTREPTQPYTGEIAKGQFLSATVRRGGAETVVSFADPATKLRAGDKRTIKAGPVTDTSPIWLGIIVFLISLGVIGTHGVLSGTASMDFGGRKAAATATGLIDGFVYLGTATQAFFLGWLTPKSWHYWPLFMLPFAAIGFYLTTRIWNAKPRGGAAH